MSFVQQFGTHPTRGARGWVVQFLLNKQSRRKNNMVPEFVGFEVRLLAALALSAHARAWAKRRQSARLSH